MDRPHKILEKHGTALLMDQKNCEENNDGMQMEKVILRKIAEILLKEHLLSVEEQMAFTQMLQEA